MTDAMHPMRRRFDRYWLISSKVVVNKGCTLFYITHSLTPLDHGMLKCGKSFRQFNFLPMGQFQHKAKPRPSNELPLTSLNPDKQMIGVLGATAWEQPEPRYCGNIR